MLEYDSKELKDRLERQKRELDESMALLKGYKDAVDASTILSKTDTKGIITYANDEFCRISGYSEEELIGRSHNIVRASDMPSEVFSAMWRDIKSKKIWKGIVKNRKKDGTFYWVDATIVPIVGQDGEIVEFIGLRHDITELYMYKNNLEEILDAKSKNLTKNIKLLEEYKNAVDASSILSKTDRYGVITYVNREFCRISGYKEEELIGKPHNIVRHNDMPKDAFAAMWSDILNQRIWKGIVKNRKKDGTFYWVKATIVPIVDDTGLIVEFVGIRQDITELMEYRESLEKKVQDEVDKNRQKDLLLQEQSAQAAIGEMVNSIAHQWRQPINSISLESGNILLDIEDRDYIQIKESAINISALTQTMSKTITDFMEFSNPHREKSRFGLKEIIDSVSKMLESQLFAKNIELINRVDETLLVYSYKNDIKQIVVNLINNAKDAYKDDFLSSQKIIDISTTLDDDILYIKVEDFAGGVREDIESRIFEPYVSTKDAQKGTGLGLYICKKIAKDGLGGDVIYKKSRDGSIFYLLIPAKNFKEE